MFTENLPRQNMCQASHSFLWSVHITYSVVCEIGNRGAPRGSSKNDPMYRRTRVTNPDWTWELYGRWCFSINVSHLLSHLLNFESFKCMVAVILRPEYKHQKNLRVTRAAYKHKSFAAISACNCVIAWRNFRNSQQRWIRQAGKASSAVHGDK